MHNGQGLVESPVRRRKEREGLHVRIGLMLQGCYFGSAVVRGIGGFRSEWQDGPEFGWVHCVRRDIVDRRQLARDGVPAERNGDDNEADSNSED